MIVGNGLIGRSLREIDRDDVIFFASGVSNSKCRDDKEFKREIDLLSKYTGTDNIFIYFSSVHSYITNEFYLEHKRKMEKLISSSIKNHIIIRLPQIIGDEGNQSNLINFLLEKIKNGEEFDMYQTKRSLLDISDLVKIVKFLIESKYVGFFDINYTETIKVDDIIKIISDFTKNKPLIRSVINMDIEIPENTEFVNMVLGIYIKEINYNKKIITKYLNKKYKQNE
jgi:nucleoside-diphosphate-sugar epimerase